MKIIGNIVAVIWFIVAVLWTVILLPLAIWIVFDDYRIVIVSGFGCVTSGFSFLVIFAFIHGITLLVPVFRKCYSKLPWLYPYMVILMLNLLNLAIGEEILNFGYQTQNTVRHVIFIILTIIQLIAGRLLICWFLKKRPIRMERYDYE